MGKSEFRKSKPLSLDCHCHILHKKGQKIRLQLLKRNQIRYLYVQKEAPHFFFQFVFQIGCSNNRDGILIVEFLRHFAERIMKASHKLQVGNVARIQQDL